MKLRSGRDIHYFVVPIVFGFSFLLGAIISFVLAWGDITGWLIFPAFLSLILSIATSRCGHVVFAAFSGLLFGALRTSPVIADQKNAASFIGRQAIISATISDTPRLKNGSIRATLNNISFNYSTKNVNSQAYAVLDSANLDISRSDRITLEGKIQPGFGNYTIALYRPRLIALNKPDPPDLAQSVRALFLRRIRRAMGAQDSTDLALGFLLGEKSLSDTQSEKLRTIGLSHIVVASGYCLSIIIGVARKVAGKLSRFAGFLASYLLIVLFISVTGLSPSLMRAGLVSGISLAISYFGRKIHPVRLLIYVASLSALINPLVIFELAWQLSFASYTGIILLLPLLKAFFFGRQKTSVFAEIILTSISAQIMCLPISACAFGSISILSIVSNILVTPLIPTVMLLTFMVGLFPFLALSATINNAILGLQLGIIDWLSRIKWGTATASIDAPFIVAIYATIFLVFFLLKLRIGYSYKPRLALDKSPKYGKIYTC